MPKDESVVERAGILFPAPPVYRGVSLDIENYCTLRLFLTFRL